jgi:hypothetical protein
MDNFLSADQIWDADDIREETIDVPEWHGKVRIRALTLEQITHLAAKVSRRMPNGQETVDRELSVALTLIYGMVEPKLTELDVARLREKSASAVTRIVQAINALGVTEEAIDGAAKRPTPGFDQALPVLVSSRTRDDEG